MDHEDKSFDDDADYLEEREFVGVLEEHVYPEDEIYDENGNSLFLGVAEGEYEDPGCGDFSEQEEGRVETVFEVLGLKEVGEEEEFVVVVVVELIGLF